MLFPEYTVETGATFSPCCMYRYSLWRIWDKAAPRLGAVLLNPSRADARFDDPTISRLVKRAHVLGFGGLVVCNLFALRATDPEWLYSAVDPVGPENNQHIVESLKPCGMVLCGWGQHGKYMDRDLEVQALLRQEVKVSPQGVVTLLVNADGTPSHPLYLSYTLRPFQYHGRIACAS